MVAADGTKGGLSIACHHSLADKVISTGKDEEGRYLWIKLKVDEQVFGICNVYAPCNAAQRRRLWRRMTAELNQSIDWFLGGNWNFVEFSNDLLGGGSLGVTRVPMEWHELRDLVLQAADPWVALPAHKHLDSLKFSWTNEQDSTAAAFRARQLDRWYVPNRWLQRIESYGTLPGTDIADHAPV